MEQHLINTINDFSFLKDYIVSTPKITIDNGNYLLKLNNEEFIIEMPRFSQEERSDIYNWVQEIKKPKESLDSLIFGKDPTQNIVSCEVSDSSLELFIEKDGIITSDIRENKFWILAHIQLDEGFRKLEGNLHYKFIKYYNTRNDWFKDKNRYKGQDIYSVYDTKEAAMLLNGFTYYKGMKVSDVSRFHFDLETTGLFHNSKSRTLLISTTFVSCGNTKKKLFSCDEYESDALMIEDFCKYVRECNPSVMSGFNIYGYDFPYLDFCARKNDVSLNLGRDGSSIRFDKFDSKFRKDGSQDYEYKRCYIYGREIVDMMHVAYHFDFARKYESYGLKKIIEQEGLQKPGRVFYDASQIYKNWNILEEREKIKAYCIDDSDDSESLYKLMISSYFYFSNSIPKSFQSINYSASGSQVNAFLVRSYLQSGHSIPKANEAIKFGGGISDGFPGIYRNVIKLDLNSLYPSIMIQYEIYDKEKDPKGIFLKTVKYFTEQRLADKKKAKETGDRYYQELEQSRKIFINSSFGMLGAPGLNFNSPSNAALVTQYGRTILKKSILWATSKEYIEKKDQIDEDS